MYIKVNNIVLNNFNDYLDYIKTINLNTIEEIFISSYINDSIAFDESLLDNDNKYIYYINFNKFINIKKITCKYLKNLSQIIINNCKKLKEITLIDCNIKKFPSYKNPNLKYICCINCNLNNININEFPQLKELIIEKNNIKYLDASKNKNLKLICAYILEIMINIIIH